MPAPTKEEVEQFIRENESFFKTPLSNQSDFKAFYEKNDALKVIKEYSDGLEKLLYANKKRLTKESTMAVVYDWRKGDFSSALEFETIRQYIMDNKDHPAIALWRDKSVTFLKNQQVLKDQQVLEEQRMLKEQQQIRDVLETSGLNSCLEQIKEKATDFKGSYPKAWRAADTLYKDLTSQKEQFISKKITKEDFVTNCKNLIDDAEKGELKNHRGFFGRIFHNIQKALNVITLGLVGVSPTDSLVKMGMFKDSLKKVDSATLPEEKTEQQIQLK
ncbi:hypothetical protein [Legionella brunensis]|uniref:Uncharacterized protein n=1 Tax=Legionella brunensis TaxID=29422 RepID=A0A0W0S0C4_9GAMM|nr:hypothetical protein [Legionella brunensis]KTC76766.1 hypothetical protein Lbru_2873 [Legionella brunensis]